MTMAKTVGSQEKAAEAAPALAAKIEQERVELADTVSALAAKVDVKARVADQVATVKDQAAGLTHDIGYQVDQVASEASATLVSLRDRAVSLRDRVRDRPGPYVLSTCGLIVAFAMVRKLTARLAR
jgi:hypothetical protein